MSSLLIRRLGIGSVAAASYGTIVYFTYQFMTINVEKNKEAIKANFGSSSTTTTSTTTGITATSATVIHAGSASREGCNCNTFTFNSITDPKRTSTFNRIAQVYDEQISRDEQVMLLPLLRRALIYLNARGKVLEVGAGTGRNLEYYSSKKVEKVVLTDVSEEMLLQARQKVKAMDGSSSSFFSSSSSNSNSKKGSSKFQLFVADAANMKTFYPDDTFDTIVDTFGLCSFDDPVAVLKELQRVCKKDGTILLLEHGRSKSWTGLSNYLDRYAERHATNWGCVWNRDLDDILEEAGLVVDTLQTWHFGTTYYVVCRPSERVKREMQMEMELMQSDITNSTNSTTMKSEGGASVTSDGSDTRASKTRVWNKWLHS